MVIERRELSARIALVLILIGLPLVIMGYQFLRPLLSSTKLFDIHMQMPENGGFSQDIIYVNTGETVTLRFYADDVTHGIAIGPNLGVDLGHIDPGKVEEVTLTFDHAGTYTYYCTTWCSDTHWRMRGQIIVRDPNNPNFIPSSAPDSVITNLEAEGVHIDGQRSLFQPLQGVGLVPLENLDGWLIPAELQDREWQISHSPAETATLLAAANPEKTPEDVYAAVAAIWLLGQNDYGIDARSLYASNCAACHGETGLSDGVAAFTTAVQPVSFGNAAYIFNMRSDVLYAKIRRGGMGTDMPNFGTIFSQDESWALVGYLWQLALLPE